MSKLSADQVNSMAKAAFVSEFGAVAEHSPWVAERAFTRLPVNSVAELVEAFGAELHGASKEDQLALIRAHPDLAGKAALAGELEEASKNEQASVGLDQLSQEELDSFTRMNTQYRDQFGFPFIFAVKGATKELIFEAFKTRLDNSVDQEFEIALQQVTRIFSFRLNDKVQ